MIRPLLCCLAGCLIPALVAAQEATVFPPLQPPKQVAASRVERNLLVNGRLDEAEWQSAPPATEFFQTEPNQGKPVAFKTWVRVLYNQRDLYLGVFSQDSLGRRGIRVPGMRLDFANGDYDQISLVFDPFRDQRNAVIFATHPYGAQRDLLAFDDEYFDVDWDSYWRVRTSRTDSGWVAEFAIPWKTLRYPKDSTNWGFQVGRVARRFNQTSSWSPHPRSFRTSRTAYAGLLTGLQPPTPSANIRVQPYLLFDYSHDQFNGSSTREETKPKLGEGLPRASHPPEVGCRQIAPGC